MKPCPTVAEILHAYKVAGINPWQRNYNTVVRVAEYTEKPTFVNGRVYYTVFKFCGCIMTALYMAAHEFTLPDTDPDHQDDLFREFMHKTSTHFRLHEDSGKAIVHWGNGVYGEATVAGLINGFDWTEAAHWADETTKPEYERAYGIGKTVSEELFNGLACPWRRIDEPERTYEFDAEKIRKAQEKLAAVA